MLEGHLLIIYIYSVEDKLNREKEHYIKVSQLLKLCVRSVISVLALNSAVVKTKVITMAFC